jgi:hypothetical protein
MNGGDAGGMAEALPPRRSATRREPGTSASNSSSENIGGGGVKPGRGIEETRLALDRRALCRHGDHVPVECAAADAGSGGRRRVRRQGSGWR